MILRDTKHIDKSLVYSFIRPWLGEGLLTGTGKCCFVNEIYVAEIYITQILKVNDVVKHLKFLTIR